MKNAKGKAPSFQFYVKDWLSDPELQKAHPTTRGVWINLLCYMWDAPERGKIETNERELCHLGSCLPEDIELFLFDAKRLDFCDFFETCHKNVTPGHNDVTLKNRRMRRDEKHRIKARKRKQKQREIESDLGENNKSHTDVTEVEPPTPIPTPIPTPTAEIIKESTDGKKAVPLKNLIQDGSIPKVKTEIQKVGKELYDNKIFPKVFVFINKMLKEQKSERAILHSLTRCYVKAMNKDGFKKDGGSWAYCTKIIQIENGNFNEAEYQKTAKKSD